jgi:hypothetical protein
LLHAILHCSLRSPFRLPNTTNDRPAMVGLPPLQKMLLTHFLDFVMLCCVVLCCVATNLFANVWLALAQRAYQDALGRRLRGRKIFYFVSIHCEITRISLSTKLTSHFAAIYNFCQHPAFIFKLTSDFSHLSTGRGVQYCMRFHNWSGLCESNSIRKIFQSGQPIITSIFIFFNS